MSTSLRYDNAPPSWTEFQSLQEHAVSLQIAYENERKEHQKTKKELTEMKAAAGNGLAAELGINETELAAIRLLAALIAKNKG